MPEHNDPDIPSLNYALRDGGRFAETLSSGLGEAPDFDAYMARLNAQINEDSVVMGQQHYWMEVEAERENRREANNWRISYAQRSHHKLFKPWGNEGPGDLAKMEQWSPRKRTAKFTWMREARGRNGGMTNAQLTVPADRLFNVSAYKPGDYLQFFKDPRTRARYLEWAGPLLVAEEYHAGAFQLCCGPTGSGLPFSDVLRRRP